MDSALTGLNIAIICFFAVSNDLKLLTHENNLCCSFNFCSTTTMLDKAGIARGRCKTCPCQEYLRPAGNEHTCAQSALKCADHVS